MTSQDGPPKVQVFTLTNGHGVEMKVADFGARIISLFVPDKTGIPGDVVLGYDTPDQYLTGNPYYGAIIGRFCNRVSKGNFTLDGTDYSLVLNDGENALHGGPDGFHNVFWREDRSRRADNSVTLVHLSKDGEEGFPGNLTVTVVYTITPENEVVIDYSATTDKKTIINLTSHAYFNLAGAGKGDILGHSLQINGDFFIPIDAGRIPIAPKSSVVNTPFDFRNFHTIGERINSTDHQIARGSGYDHNWILNKSDGDDELSLAAKVIEERSGRVMEMFTTEPGLQFYSGNFLEGSGADVGKGQKPYPWRSAFCLEAQHFPDSPNRPDYPSVVLAPGERYRQKTIYKFSTQ